MNRRMITSPVATAIPDRHASRTAFKLFAAVMAAALLMTVTIAEPVSRAASAEESQPSITKAAERSILDSLFSRRTYEATAQEVRFVGVYNVRSASGLGERMEFWRRAHGSEDWEIFDLDLGRLPSMKQLYQDPLDEDSILFSYVDRQNDPNRVVYLERFSTATGERETILEFSNGSGVLNPIGAVTDENILHFFIPNRTGTFVRWFTIDLTTDEIEQLPNITLPVGGARMYDATIIGDKLLAPIGVNGQLHYWHVNLTDGSIVTTQIDQVSPSNEQPREMAVHDFSNKGLAVITYLSPASFSFRPFTGLVGEVVAHAVDLETGQSIQRTVVGGFDGSRASTHYVPGQRIDLDRFAVAYTAVDRVHQHHLNENHQNYVYGRVGVFTVDDQGQVELESDIEVDPFWHAGLTLRPDGLLSMSSNEAAPGDRLWHTDFAITPAPYEPVVADMRAAIDQMGLHAGLHKPLQNMLDDVVAQLLAGDSEAACSAVDDLVNHVDVREGKPTGPTAAQAEALRAHADGVRALIGC